MAISTSRKQESSIVINNKIKLEMDYLKMFTVFHLDSRAANIQGRQL